MALSRLGARVCGATLLVLAFFLGTAHAASAAPITIDPGAYAGHYYVAPFTGTLLSGVSTVDLADGTYALDDATTTAGSSFAFTVSGGKVVSAAPASATPSADGSTLVLRNTTVTIAPGGYTGRYFLTSFGTGTELSGAQSIVLVPGLQYGLDDGTEATAPIGGVPVASDFLFDVAADGSVTVVPGSPSVPATASGSTLMLNSVQLLVSASTAAVQYRLCSQPGSAVQTGDLALTVIPGLLNCAYDGTTEAVFVASPAAVTPPTLTLDSLTLTLVLPATTPSGLVALTRALVTGSAAYASLAPGPRTAVDALLALLDRRIAPAASLTAGRRAVFDAVVRVFGRFGVLTPDRVALLTGMAAAL